MTTPVSATGDPARVTNNCAGDRVYPRDGNARSRVIAEATVKKTVALSRFPSVF